MVNTESHSHRRAKAVWAGIVFFVLMLCGPAHAGEVIWFDGKHPVSYAIEGYASPVVMEALQMFCDDMEQVTGMRPVSRRRHATIRIRQRRGGSDGFRITAQRGRLLVEGFSGRGTAYGLLELSRMAGVSPWIWWGDVVPARKQRLAVADTLCMEQKPSVEYRGIFLNDEDWSTRRWSAHNAETEHHGQQSAEKPSQGNQHEISAETYRHIFQLLLRLRANTIWPAMHEGTTAFFHTPGAKGMAEAFDIVVGTSHCEPLLRNNVGEWNTQERGRFNYRTNRQAVKDYWAERLRQVNGRNNYFYTIGMRGIHDSSMEGYTTEQEKYDALQQVIDDQQELLRQFVGEPRQLPQIFVPYKEVLQLYEKGLRVPNYVTLLWCDDNYGYLTRLSGQSEQQRSGGSGIYYHLSYWGRPHDYLWLCTTQPGLIAHELLTAYERNARRLWIANVHDPKVASYNLELFLDLAWNAEQCLPSFDTFAYYRSRIERDFGAAVASAIAPAMHDFFRLCAQRRPEFTGFTQVELDKKRYPRGLSPVDTLGWDAEEAARRLADLGSVRKTIEHGATLADKRLADAYFATIAYPVLATEAMNRKMLLDSAGSHRAYMEIQQLTEHYNSLAGNKWRGLMDAAPRQLPVFADISLSGHRPVLSEPHPVPIIRIPAAEGVWQADTTMKNFAKDPSAAGITHSMLGYSMNSVSLPRGTSLSFTFTVPADGHYTLRTCMVPTHPLDGGDLRYSVSIDGGQAMVYSLREPFRSEQWKQNVLRQQAQRHLTVALGAGTHRLTVRAIDDNIVFDEWLLFGQ